MYFKFSNIPIHWGKIPLRIYYLYGIVYCVVNTFSSVVKVVWYYKTNALKFLHKSGPELGNGDSKKWGKPILYRKNVFK